ncbi:MAG TPA: hypothetical protein VFA20_35505 [Myxococcaceae bacterium]|nr:hypothetical protein [Myxococcaceae bacterium]
MLRKLASIPVALTSLALVACGPHKPVDFSQGVPTKQQATVKMPTSSSSGLREAGSQDLPAADQLQAMAQAMKQAVQGETADTYRLTVGATYLVNGATEWLLVALAAGVAQKPSSVSGDTAIYGPYTPYLSAITWKLTVTRTAFNSFSYLLEGQDKTKPSSPWVSVISGSHTVTVDANDNAIKGFGEGVFMIEWDKAKQLPGRGADTGTCEVHYGKVDPKSQAFVDVSLNNIGADGKPFNAEYRFTLDNDNAGSFQFALDINLQPFDSTKQAPERMSIESRWLSTGAGRADVTAHDGDLVAPITGSECWDASFLSQYYVRTDEPANTYGVEARDCAFTSAQFSQL